MDTTLEFTLHENVKIPDIHKDIIGVVVGIYLSDKGTQYLVRYFWECKPNEVYFYSWELCKYDTK